MKDKSEVDVARIKATLMLTYGFVTFYAPPSLITSRIEVNILATIMPHFSNVREQLVKENLIRCVELIGKDRRRKDGSLYLLSLSADLCAGRKSAACLAPPPGILCTLLAQGRASTLTTSRRTSPLFYTAVAKCLVTCKPT